MKKSVSGTPSTPLWLKPQDDPNALDRAVKRLVDGYLLAFPTETVYGLGARADDDRAVREIFLTKGRPSDHPLIVHVADRHAADAFAADLPLAALRLIDRFWPGPLTVIVPRRAGIATQAAGGHNTIGLRCPQHPMALQLLQLLATQGVMGLAAPSANRFGKVSPTRAEHVLSEFPSDDLWVLDGGPCGVGIESAIVDCTREHPVLLRPGVLNLTALEAVVGEPLAWLRPETPDLLAPRAPGTLQSHYAPTTPVRLMNESQITDALDRRLPHMFDLLLGGDDLSDHVAVYSRSLWTYRLLQPGVQMRVMPAQPDLAAQSLFADLRDMDALKVGQIWVESPPQDPAWDGVRDRLLRAAAL